MAERNVVTGITGGNADTVIAAGQIHGGVANKTTHRHGSRAVNIQGGNVGNLATGDNHTGNMVANMSSQCQTRKQIGPTTNQDLRESQNPQLFSGDFKAENQAFGSGDINKGSSPAQSKTDPEDLTSEDLLALIRKRECSEETMKIFVKERVTGSEFMEDDILEQLNITNSTDVRKLTSLQKKLRNK